MSTTGRTRWPMAVALAAAIALTAIPAPSQVIENPDSNLPAVQDPGPAFPMDQPIEVRLTPGAQRALQEGAGWDAMTRGLEVVYDGERPMKIEVHAALVDRNGEVRESRRLDSMTLERGSAPVSAKQIVFVPEPERVVPAAVFFPNETYFPGSGRGSFFPGTGRGSFVPGSGWDARHGVTNPDNMNPRDGGKTRKPRGPGVFTDRGPEDDAKVVRKKPGRTTDERTIGIQPGRAQPHPWEGLSLVVTVVPTDPDARGKVPVRPLVVDLDAIPHE